MLKKRCKAETFGLSLLDLLKRQRKRKYNGAKFILKSKCLATRPVTWTWSPLPLITDLPRFFLRSKLFIIPLAESIEHTFLWLNGIVIDILIVKSFIFFGLCPLLCLVLLGVLIIFRFLLICVG